MGRQEYDYEPVKFRTTVPNERIDAVYRPSRQNGREIYEGDIFEGPYSDRPYSSTKRFQNRRGSVQWNPDQGCIPYPTTGDFEYRFFPTWHECEIIGNIYENPELLKETGK
jgi:hypothetical protein